MPMTKAQRVLRAKMGAHALHARVEDPQAHTKPAHDAFMARFEKEADPDGVLPEEERQRRAGHLRSAYMARLAYASSKARAAKKTRGE